LVIAVLDVGLHYGASGSDFSDLEFVAELSAAGLWRGRIPRQVESWNEGGEMAEAVADRHVPRFPELLQFLLDALARASPATQASGVSSLVYDLRDSDAARNRNVPGS